MSALEAEFAHILDGAASHAETLAFLERSLAWMGDAEALAAGARALRARMAPKINAPHGAIDVCGTGGDGAHTLNISTAVALVVAGAGAPVAKHGNRAMSSKSGGADVLERLGVKLTGDAATLERCLAEAGVAFLFAQNHHPAMRHVAAARRELGKRTIFNLLGPLSNPAAVRRQLMGVFAPDYVAPLAEALNALGAERAWVVHGAGGLDEVSLAGPTEIVELRSGATRRFVLAPADFGVEQPVSVERIRGGDAEVNAAALRTLLASPAEANQDYRAVVIANAAAALAVAGKAEDLTAARAQAEASLLSGAALKALERLIAISGSAP